MPIPLGIITNIIAAAGTSVAAASAISVIKEWLNKKIKTKIRVGEFEIEFSSKDKSSIYNQLVSTVKELKIHPKVFIVYPHSKKEFVSKLADDLGKAGINVWLDENKLKPGDKIFPQIKKALEESQWVILVPLPEDRGSSWVYKKVDMAYEEEKVRSRTS